MASMILPLSHGALILCLTHNSNNSCACRACGSILPSKNSLFKYLRKSKHQAKIGESVGIKPRWDDMCDDEDADVCSKDLNLVSSTVLSNYRREFAEAQALDDSRHDGTPPVSNGFRRLAVVEADDADSSDEDETWDETVKSAVVGVVEDTQFGVAGAAAKSAVESASSLTPLPIPEQRREQSSSLAQPWPAPCPTTVAGLGDSRRNASPSVGGPLVDSNPNGNRSLLTDGISKTDGIPNVVKVQKGVSIGIGVSPTCSGSTKSASTSAASQICIYSLHGDEGGPRSGSDKSASTRVASQCSVHKCQEDELKFLDKLDRDSRALNMEMVRAQAKVGNDVTEFYSPPRIAHMAKLMGLTPDYPRDLTTRGPGGFKWDFTRARDRLKAWKLIKRDRPYLIVGSPPCTAFSVLQNLIKQGVDLNEKLHEELRE